MGKSKRKYYVSEYGSVNLLKKKSFLVHWNESENDRKSSIAKAAGPFTDYKQAEEIMVKHLINGVCSWIVSYNG